MRIVVALGGNALLRRGQPMTIENQRANVAVACEHLAAVMPVMSTSVVKTVAPLDPR